MQEDYALNAAKAMLSVDRGTADIAVADALIAAHDLLDRGGIRRGPTGERVEKVLEELELVKAEREQAARALEAENAYQGRHAEGYAQATEDAAEYLRRVAREGATRPSPAAIAALGMVFERLVRQAIGEALTTAAERISAGAHTELVKEPKRPTKGPIA